MRLPFDAKFRNERDKFVFWACVSFVVCTVMIYVLRDLGIV